MNTWPNGYRHAMEQDAHATWNAVNYPGTRQLCVECDSATGRCEEDAIYTEDGRGPLCVECWHKTEEWLQSTAAADAA